MENFREDQWLLVRRALIEMAQRDRAKGERKRRQADRLMADAQLAEERANRAWELLDGPLYCPPGEATR